MNNLTVIKNFMVDNGLEYLLVNSTNEFLVEYNTLEDNSRYKITGFTGSTGEALVTPDTIFLFVDGRYHIQADNEVDHENITVIKLQNGQNFWDELVSKIPENKPLGVFLKKISQQKLEILQKKRKVKLLDNDPLDSDKSTDFQENITLETNLTGLSKDEKISKISQSLSPDEVIYITDLDEVSYLFNMRNFSQNFSAKIKGKCLVFKDKATLYTQNELAKLDEILKNTNKKFLIDKCTINAYDYRILASKSEELKENPVKMMKSCKTESEINHLKIAFSKTDKALSEVRDYIENNENISESDIAQKLENEFKNQGALGLSFKSIVAKDENSALAHYSKSSKTEIIKDGSLVLIDCGAYFEGGLATDITRVFVKGTPSELHKKVYTTVLKAFLRGYRYENPQNGFEIDKTVREFLHENAPEGFIFNHGLGHGIGINVHECPPNLSPSEAAKTSFKEGMCFTIEPGLYREGFFGVRLENSCYFQNNKIHSFVKMNYEKKLIDFEMLTEQEKIWLKEFEVK